MRCSPTARRAELLRQQALEIKEAQETDGSETGSPEESRTAETYGLSTFEQLSEEDLSAFERATEFMSDLEKTRAAQSVHVLASAWANAQNVMSGGITMATVDPDATMETALQYKGMLEVMSESGSILNRMGEDSRGFLQRYQRALLGGEGVDTVG